MPNYNRKYERIDKTCPVCEKVFTTLKGHKREKTTCSHSCANSYFRSGIQHGNWKEDRYRSTCFHHHEKKCVVCGEDKIVEVHHFDGDSTNNSPENLVPLCPTHHAYWHSRYLDEIEHIVVDYINSFKEKLYDQNDESRMADAGNTEFEGRIQSEV